MSKYSNFLRIGQKLSACTHDRSKAMPVLKFMISLCTVMGEPSLICIHNYVCSRCMCTCVNSTRVFDASCMLFVYVLYYGGINLYASLSNS